MTFKSRVRDFLDTQLDKSLPPEPERVEEDYAESVRSEITENYPELADEYLGFLSEEMSRYRLLHPDTVSDDTPGDRGAYKTYLSQAVGQAKMQRWDLVVEFAEHLAEMGQLPYGMDPQDMIEDVQEELEEKGEWKDDWDSAIRGDGDE